MPDNTLPKTEVTVELPDGVNAGHATVSNSLRNVDGFRVTHTPERQVSAGLTVPEYMTLNVGQASVSLPPFVWLKIVDALTRVLADVPSLTAVDVA